MTETRKPPKEREETPKALEPAILGILTDGEDEALPSSSSTPAEIITDKQLDEDEKRRQLLRTWGSKGGQTTAKRKTKWKEKFVEIARQLATIGITEGDMAALFQVNQKTFRGWKRVHQALTLALKEGDGLKKANLTMQMQAAAASGQIITQIFLAKNWLGMTDKADVKMSGGQTITYKSMIPQEKGGQGVDPGSIKGMKSKKIQDRDPER